LIKFIYEKAVPTIDENSFDARDVYEKINHPIITVLADVNRPKNEKGYQYIVNRLKKVAAKFKGKFLFSVLQRKDYARELSDFEFPSSLVDKKNEVLVGLRVNDRLYTNTKSFSVETALSFLVQYLVGQLISKVSE
jgi:hypothetical protein